MDAAPDILSLRKALDWSQDQMGEYLGLDRSTVSRLESGGTIKKPVRELLRQLADRAPIKPRGKRQADEVAA